MTTFRLLGHVTLPLLICVVFFVVSAPATANDLVRDPRLDAQADTALDTLFAQNAEAAKLSETAAAVLVFPRVARMGFGLGAEQGYGVLRMGSKVDGYYRLFSVSVGAQGGFQIYGYAILFMTQNAVDAFKANERYEIGANGSIAIATAGATADTEPSRLKTDTHEFIFDEAGLMVSATVKLGNITPYER